MIDLRRRHGSGEIALEDRTIQQIPPDQRHGRPRDLFTLWFGMNLTTLTIATGALCTTVFHLSLAASLFAIVFGNLFGAIFMALHAAQGPHLGVPQMVQTRGQFGARGALAVIAFVAIMDVGFFASNLVLSAQSLHRVLPSASPSLAVAAVAIIGTLATIFGHDLIHRFTRWVSWAGGLAIFACFAWILGHHPDFAAAPTSRTTVGALLGAISTSVLWQIAYAPYVSDYSRYLPAETGQRAAFWTSYWGCALGSILPMALGAVLGSLFPAQEITESLAASIGPLAYVAIPILTLAIAAASAISLYCAVLSTIAIVQTFVPAWQARAGARIWLSLVLALTAVAMAVLAGPHFMETYTNFLLLLLYVMVPWTAINLVDYYLIRQGDYDVASFLRADGGIYGNYNVPALLAYLAGIAVQVPFVANALYTGPIARLLNGADLSWIAGLLIVSPLYYGLARRSRNPAGRAAASR
jgi:NCS1 family nucleobase:cation symporter-1